MFNVRFKSILIFLWLDCKLGTNSTLNDLQDQDTFFVFKHFSFHLICLIGWSLFSFFVKKSLSIARDQTRPAEAPVKHLFSFSKTKILTRLFANLIISVKVIFGKTTCSIQTGYLKMAPPRPLFVYFRSFQTLQK